jgi:prepilin-type N-terminal cleavage/methylation domain-containing protein
MDKSCGDVSHKIYNRFKRQILRLSFNRSGFTLIEILISIVIVGVIGLNIIMFQTSSWKRTSSSNKLLVAGQMIEKQIEYIRMTVDSDPVNKFPPHDSTITENGIKLCWNISSAYRPKGPSPRGPLLNVRRCDLTASWGSTKNDSLVVTTYIARYF